MINFVETRVIFYVRLSMKKNWGGGGLNDVTYRKPILVTLTVGLIGHIS